MQSPESKPERDPLAEEIGREIGRARTVRGLSVSEVHRKTGISRTVLQGYEAGRYKPGARELRLLANVLDCSPNRLLFGFDDFKKRGPLDELLGSTEKIVNGAKIGTIFHLLTLEEQKAFLTLLKLIVEARVGGREELGKILNVTDTLLASFEADPESVEKRMEAFVGDAAMRKVLEDVVAPEPPKLKPKRRTKD